MEGLNMQHRVIPRPWFLALFGLFFWTANFSQTYSIVSTDGEIYSFLNWMIRHEKKYDEEPRFKNKQISPHILAWDEGNFVIDDTVLNNKYKYFSLYNEYLFSEKPLLNIASKPEDKAFLIKQYTAIQDSVWHKKFSKSTLLKREEQKRANRYYLSIPLFSRSKK